MKQIVLLTALCLSFSSPLWAKAVAKTDKKAAPTKPAGDALLLHSITLKPLGSGAAYVSLHAGKAYTAEEAVAHKAELDFVYLVKREGSTVKRELYNLSGKDTTLPADVIGTKSGIVSLSWDDDQVAKCKSVPDLKRMAGGYTPNSFTFYATLANNQTGAVDQKRFIFSDVQERMGFFTAKLGAGDELILDVKIANAKL